MTLIRQIASFLRWRLIPVRYAGRVARVRVSSFRRRKFATMGIARNVEQTGYALGKHINAALLQRIIEIYEPRKQGVSPKENGHPFINLVTNEDVHIDNPLWHLLFSRDILDVARDYFGGHCTLDSVQVLYSWQTTGRLRESQKWHKDYGDSKSLHFLIYLNDVFTDDDGPFVFVDKGDSQKIRRSPVIRRIEDDQFLSELGEGEIIRFFGTAGDYAVVDPAACYHYGSRCRLEKGRLALFLTFNSDLPFVAAQDLIVNNRQTIRNIAKSIRPDLDNVVLNRLLAV